MAQNQRNTTDAYSKENITNKNEYLRRIERDYESEDSEISGFVPKASKNRRTSFGYKKPRWYEDDTRQSNGGGKWNKR